MNKREAIELFDSPRELAEVLGITPQAIYQWPDEIAQDRTDRIVGAAVRVGRFRVIDNKTGISPRWLPKPQPPDDGSRRTTDEHAAKDT